MVTYLVPGAPLPAYNPYPPHNSLSVDPESDLSWTFGNDTETYDLYFDTQFPPLVKVISDAPSGAAGTYDPGTMEFNTDLFDLTTIERMFRHYEKLLGAIVANPEQRLSRLPMLFTAEQQQLLVTWNETAEEDNYDW